MIKILIVDDEYLIRDLIKDCLNYEELGFTIIGEAEDGIEAIKKIEELKPELIILDISIPFINGIELSKIVKKKYKEIKILILTGYSEFEYAKECIKIGVSEYLLKPINSNTLKTILEKIGIEIIRETKHKQYLFQLENEIKSSYDVLREQFLYNLITKKSMPDATLKDEFRKYGIHFSGDDIVVISIKIDNYLERWESNDERELWKFAVMNIANEVLYEVAPSVTFYGSNHHIVCIAFSELDSNERFTEMIMSACRKISNNISNILSFTVTVGIGSCYKGYDKIGISYEESIHAVAQKFFEGHNRIIKYAALENTGRMNSINLIKLTDDLIIQLKMKNKEAYTHLIHDLNETLSKNRLTAEAVRLIYSIMTESILHCSWYAHAEVKEASLNADDYIEKVNNIETVFDLENWFINFCDTVVDMVNDNKQKTIKTVNKARLYIEENYFKPDISLAEIAERIFVNPSYLSKIFKREMEYNITEFITELRLKKAKEIIDECSDIQIGQVAKQVGYSDPFYFSKLFKKYYGVSPSKYIDNK